MLPQLDPEEAEASLDGIDGLLLTGGDDLDPALYGGTARHEKEVPLLPARERFDMALVHAAVKRDVPVLAIYGSLDRSLDPLSNARLASGQLPENSEVTVLDGLNHLLQEAVTGSPTEYLSLPGGISDAVVGSVANWILP